MLQANFQNLFVNDTFQIALRDGNGLMPQQTGKCIDIASVAQLCMSEGVATGMGRDTDGITHTYIFSGFSENSADDFLCHWLASLGEEKVIVHQYLPGKIAAAGQLIFLYELLKNGREGYIPLFSPFSVDKNGTLLELGRRKSNQFIAADSCIEQDGHQGIIAHIQIGMLAIIAQHLFDLILLEGFDFDLGLPDIVDFLCVETVGVPLIQQIMREGAHTAQNVIDVLGLCAAVLFVEQIHLEVLRQKVFDSIYLCLFCYPQEEGAKELVIALNGARR